MITIIFILLIATAFAYYMHQRLKNRREQEHERRMERFERLMDQLKITKEDTQENNKTGNNETT